MMEKLIEVGFVDGSDTFKGYINPEAIVSMHRTKKYTVVRLIDGIAYRVFEKPETILNMIESATDISVAEKETKKKRNVSKK